MIILETVFGAFSRGEMCIILIFGEELLQVSTRNVLYLCFREEMSLWFTLGYYNIQQGLAHFCISFIFFSTKQLLTSIPYAVALSNSTRSHTALCFPHLRSDSSMQSSLKPAEWLSRDQSGKLVMLGGRGVRMKRNLDWSRDTCNAWQPFLGPSDLADFWLILWEHYKLWIGFVWALYKIFPGFVGGLAVENPGSDLAYPAVCWACSPHCKVQFAVWTIPLWL